MQSRLKLLELQGYKTFASRTPFEFSNSITAIVGPNGSGKSNIADSIRWVLGEQSYSLLRGKRTEDMIFTGSDSRPRSGMASATITFDNSDGWLPIDFSEVAVTRRAYRDGQNEYLLNGQRVRLKDVSELLANSGLAERTYTIIGQGLVDTALAIKPEERRRLFEEAAGISLHRSRREESLRRLETTRRNLERAQDILAELQPRLRSLERQARRAKEYDQIKADLQVYLREWYGFHWHRAQHELRQARESVKIQEARLEKSRSEHQQVSEHLNQNRTKLQTLRQQLNEWHRELSQQHNLQEQLNRKLAVADERDRSLRLQKENLTREIQRINEELNINLDRLQAFKGEVSKLETELAEAVGLRAEAVNVMNSQLSLRKHLEETVRAASDKYSGIINDQVSTRVRLTETESQIVKTGNLLHQSTQTISRLEKEIQRNKTEHLLLRERVASSSKEVSELQQEQEDLRRKRLETTTDKEHILSELQQYQTDAARDEAQLKVLRQAEDALSGYALGTRFLMDAAHNRRIQGVLGTFNQFLQVPEQYEVAVTAVLGEFLDAVVIEADVGGAMDQLLKEREKGVLLPLQLAIEAPSRVKVLDLSGTHGVAADLVSCAPEVKAYLEILLGSVIVVENRSQAEDLLLGWNQRVELNAVVSGLTLVTLQGEVIHAKGPRIVGVKGTDDQSLLGRTRQITELEEQRSRSNSRLGLLKEQIARVDLELEQLDEQYSHLVEEYKKSVALMDELTILSNQSQQVIDTNIQQLEWHKGQNNRYQKDLDELIANKESLSSKANELQEAVRGAKRILDEKNRELNESLTSDPNEPVAHWNTTIAVIEKTLESSRSQLAERQSSLAGLQSEKTAIINRDILHSQAIDQLAGEIAEWQKQEGTISAALKELMAKVDPAEKETAEFERKQIQLEKNEQNARQSLNIIEDHTSQTRIGLTRRQDALESMQRRIEEDFGLVDFEYVDDVSGPTPLPLDGMVEQLPVVTSISDEVEEGIKRTKTQLRRIGPVNPEALNEFQEVSERFTFLNEQVSDLEKAELDIRKVIQELDLLMQNEFIKTFEAVAVEFREIFQRLFSGGSARLVLANPENLTESGVDIEAKLPGRRMQGLSLLSGGERSLTAIALVFSLLKVSPTPFCLLDEVDAMLDEANVNRYCELLLELSKNTQFVIVTHNRYTVQVADYIYGVTLGKDLASQVLSLRADEINQVIGEE